MNLDPVSNKLATTSLVLGILGWGIYLLQWCFDLSLGLALAALTAGTSVICGTILDVLPFILWITGIVSGHVSLSQIKHTGGRGRGRAIWGLLLNYFGLFFFLIIILGIIILITTGVQAGWLDKVLPQIQK
jgi:hypothetical protein